MASGEFSLLVIMILFVMLFVDVKIKRRPK